MIGWYVPEEYVEYEVRMSTGKNLSYQKHLLAKLEKVYYTVTQN